MVHRALPRAVVIRPIGADFRVREEVGNAMSEPRHLISYQGEVLNTSGSLL